MSWNWWYLYISPPDLIFKSNRSSSFYPGQLHTSISSTHFLFVKFGAGITRTNTCEVQVFHVPIHVRYRYFTCQYTWITGISRANTREVQVYHVPIHVRYSLNFLFWTPLPHHHTNRQTICECKEWPKWGVATAVLAGFERYPSFFLYLSSGQAQTNWELSNT